MADETRVERLFLGGPLHGRRIMVELDSWQYMAPAPMSPVFTWQADDMVFDMPTVAYTLRRTPARDDRVFVAPDYTYDTPEWMAFDTEAWVGRIVPDHTGWEHINRWFWRGKPEDFKVKRYWTYLLGDKHGEAYVTVSVTDDVAREAAAYVEDEMRDQLEHHLLPTCVVPGCTEKAPTVFVAAENGRLASRAWRKGDAIRLCPPHAHDVYRAQGAFGVDQLADWLKPDAKVSAEDHLWAVAGRIVSGDPYDQYARMIRLAQKMQADG